MEIMITAQPTARDKRYNFVTYDSMPYSAKYYTNLAFIYQIFIVHILRTGTFPNSWDKSENKKELSVCSYGTHNLVPERENKQ